MNRPARSPSRARMVQEGGQRLGCRAGHAHGGAAGESGGWALGGASTLRGAVGNADSHGENRRTEIWITKVRSEVLGWIGAPGLSRPRQKSTHRARRERECRMRCRCEWPSGREHSTLGVCRQHRGCLRDRPFTTCRAMPGAAGSGTTAAMSLLLRQETRAWPRLRRRPLAADVQRLLPVVTLPLFAAYITVNCTPHRGHAMRGAGSATASSEAEPGLGQHVGFSSLPVKSQRHWLEQLPRWHTPLTSLWI
jgi:hypothetical protein